MYIDTLDVVALEPDYVNSKSTKKKELKEKAHIHWNNGGELKDVVPLVEQFHDSLKSYNGSKVRILVEIIDHE
tara:strand:- start:22 stop:240 length:219 start_codon:yes stop_codon:yes gene_type:complete